MTGLVISGSPRRHECGIDEGHVEPDVVADDHGVGEELDHRRKHGIDRRCAHHHRLGDAGEHGDHRRDRPTRVDQALQRAEALAAANLDHADLGDEVDCCDRRRWSRCRARRTSRRPAVAPRSSKERCPPAATRIAQVHHERMFDVKNRRSIRRRAGLCTVDRVSGETPADVPDQALQSALELAVGVAAAGVKLRPPLSFPPGLKRFLRFHKLPPAALSQVRAAVEGDDDFRQQLASVATPELVDEIGMLWLSRPDGWQQAIAERLPQKPDDDEAMIRRETRKRLAAEESAARARAEVLALTVELEREARVEGRHGGRRRSSARRTRRRSPASARGSTRRARRCAGAGQGRSRVARGSPRATGARCRSRSRHRGRGDRRSGRARTDRQRHHDDERGCPPVDGGARRDRPGR